MLALVLSPRWILWHLLTLGAMATCGGLAVWQWQRAGSELGSAANVGYGLQWPIFAIFFGVMWWRFLRMEVRDLRETAPSDAGVDSPDAADRAAGTGTDVGVDRPAPAGPSPFVRSPSRARSVSDQDDPELAEYNRMLAGLDERARTEVIR